MQTEKSDSPELTELREEIQLLKNRMARMEVSLKKLKGPKVQSNKIESSEP